MAVLGCRPYKRHIVQNEHFRQAMNTSFAGIDLVTFATGRPFIKSFKKHLMIRTLYDKSIQVLIAITKEMLFLCKAKICFFQLC